MKTKAENYQAGFTLIEYIVALVIAAIAGAMVYVYMGTMMTKSSEPIFRLQKASNLHQVMENIVADYNRLNALNLRYKWQASTSYTIGSVVLPTTSTGYYYTCVTAGTSAATAPTWPTTTGATVTNGTVTWKVGGIIWKASGTPVENIVWHTSHAYSANDIIMPIKNDGHYYRCSTAHTSTTEPVAWKSSTGYVVGNIVRPSSYNGHYYRCTVAGTSGSTQPAWLLTASSVTSDGPVRWTETWTDAGTILAKSTTTASNNDDVLNDNIWNYLTTTSGSRYGTGYTVVTAVANQPDFIQFTGTPPAMVAAGTSSTSTEKNILKVTIQDSSTSETLTQLFTIR